MSFVIAVSDVIDAVVAADSQTEYFTLKIE